LLFVCFFAGFLGFFFFFGSTIYILKDMVMIIETVQSD